MKQVKTTDRRGLAAAILAGLLVLSVVLYIVISSLSAAKDPADTETPKYDPIDGEDQNAQNLYPTIDADTINWIRIDGKDNEHTYDLLKNDEDGTYILYYRDENGTEQVYYPDICEADSAFSYSSLYAADAFGTGSIARLYYLKQGLCTVSFGERIPLAAEGAERDAALAEYGFAEKTTTIHVRYEEKTEAGESRVTTHKIVVGGELVSDNGYYLMVDDRPYIYSAEDTMLDYAMQSSAYYINPRLVSTGLTMDGVQEPYLTTMYRQWKNVLTDKEGTPVPANAKVIVRALSRTPFGGGTGAPTDGYTTSALSSRTFDLSALTGSAYRRLREALVGERIGALSDPLTVTVVTEPNALQIKEGETTLYTYRIERLESILTETGELTEVGTAVGDNSLLKVAYTYTVGETTSTQTYGIIDLSSDLLPASAVEALRGMKVGENRNEDDFVTFSLQYTEDNANKRVVRILLTEIMSIYNSDATATENVAVDGSLVSYRYCLEIDGKKQEKTYSLTVKLSREELGDEIYTALLGRRAGKLTDADDDLLASYTEYSEIFSDFITYEISEISYFVTSEEIVAFRFQNASERDPFYGETIYENLTEKKKLYGLSDTNCEGTVKLLGGVGSNTSLSAGLVGSETVAIGITPENMKKYGLYANTVYFELPRGITVAESGAGEDDSDDYTWLDTLGFTLYISDRQADGSRYIASDMYGIVVRIVSEDLRFLDYDFAEYWARQKLLLLDVKNLAALDVEFFMDDLKGRYGFSLKHTTYYVTSEGKGYLTPPEDTTAYSEYDRIELTVTPSGADATDNIMLSYLRALGTNTLSLTDFYNATLGDGESLYIRNDSAGTAYFKELLQILYRIPYAGLLTEEDKAQIAADAPCLMKLSVRLTDSAYRYAFEFYRTDDRRVAVRLYRESDGGDAIGAVNDFYVSAFAFKKVGQAFVSLLDGREIDGDNAYEY